MQSVRPVGRPEGGVRRAPGWPDAAPSAARSEADLIHLAPRAGGPAEQPAAARSDPASLRQRGEHALFADGSLLDARRWFGAAYDAAQSGHQPEELARAALGLGGLWLHEHRSAAGAADVEARQRRALSGLDPGSPLALRLRLRLAAEADYRQGANADVLALVEEARRAEDPVALAEASSLAHHCLLGPEHAALRLTMAGDLLMAGARTGRRADVLMGLLWRTVDLFLAGDRQAERSLSELRVALCERDHLAVGFVVSALEVMLAIRAGRFEAAQTLAGSCAEHGAAAGDADATGWYGAQLVAIRWFQGRSGELLPYLRDVAHSPTLSAADNAYFAALAVAAALAGDPQQATCALARLRGRHLRQLTRSSSWLVAMNGVIEAAHLLGDGQTSAQAYALVRPFARLPMMASLGAACFGSSHQALGLASMTLGEVDRAVRHFEAAVLANQALGHWPATVLARHRLGWALGVRDEGGDADDAAGHREAAAREASRLGMVLPPSGVVGASRCPTAARAADTPAAEAVRQGRQWLVRLDGRVATIGDCLGMTYLAVLLSRPGVEVPALELVAAGAAGRPGQLRQPGQQVLDDVARRAYRRRLAELDAQLDRCRAIADAAGEAAAEAERTWLVSELKAAIGLGGHPRRFGDDTERARIAVGKAVRRAIDRLAAADPTIGRALRSGVHTGVRCCYQPADVAVMAGPVAARRTG